MEAEHRHQVVGGQGGPRQAVEVGTHLGLQAKVLHGRGEQLGVGLAGPAVAVLVSLDLDQRRSPWADQPRDGPRVRVRLLELVRAPVHGKLGQLVAVPLPGHGRSQGRTGPLGHHPQRHHRILRQGTRLVLRRKAV